MPEQPGARNVNDRDLINALKALADGTRFRMVQEIASAGELSCGQVAEHFDVSQPTVSHHLKILVDANILIRRSEGKHNFISVNHALLGALADALPGRLAPNARREKSTREPARRA